MSSSPSSSPPAKRKRKSLTAQIMVGLAAGIVTGLVVNKTNPQVADWFKPFSELFIRLVKMIIAPIIFSSLVAGVAGAGHIRRVGRMGIWAMVYFEVVTLFALLVGLLAVNILKPGVGLQLPTQAYNVEVPSHSWDEVLLHTVPTSIFRALAENDVLQIVIFSILFGLSLGMLKDKGRAKPLVAGLETVAEAMFKLTHIIMHYAPLGVGAAIAYTIGKGGLDVLMHLAWLVGSLYLTLVVFVVAVLLPIASFFKVPLRKFWMVVREPAIIAFSTTSSEAALPRAMEGLERLGVPRRIVSFILPLGYSFNLDGSTLYLSLAAVFVSQVANIELSLSQQISMLLTLMLTSKGVAAVPRATIIILAGTLASYGLPLEGLTLILGVDALMDMARTTTNVIGNCLATVVVAKNEGEFQEASMESLLRAQEEDDL